MITFMMLFCWWCPPSTPPPKQEIESPGYKLASKMLTESINVSVDPCQDFYEFTCGNWRVRNPIPGHHASYSQYKKLTDKVQNELREMFESKKRYRSKVLNGLMIHYKKCMDINEQNRIGANRMIRTLKSSGLVWPILEGDHNWKKERFDLTSLLSFVSSLRRVDLFVNFKADEDASNSLRYLLSFTAGGLSMPVNIYNKDTYANKFKLFRKFLLEKVLLYQQDGKFDTDKKKIEKDVDEVIELEAKVAKIRTSLVNYEEDDQSHRFRDLRKYMPSIDWDRFFRKVAPAAYHSFFDSNPEILLTDIDYLERLSELLNKTDPRIITNYVFLRFSAPLTKEMGEKYDDVTQDYYRAQYGQQEKAPRDKECAERTINLIKYGTSAMYVRKAFDEESKQVAFDMIGDLQEAFRKMLRSNDWLDGKTREYALYKTEKMLRLIAYPDFILSDVKLDNHYKGLELNEYDSYAEVLEKVARWNIEYIFERLTKPLDRTEYNFNSAAVNAYYDSQNSIKLPAAILQAPFFHHTFPKWSEFAADTATYGFYFRCCIEDKFGIPALNYGGIGSIIGHEITHGFDNTGSEFDAYGNLHDWWDIYTRKKFERRAQCFINQYSKIEVPGTNHNIDGERTLGENIADNGGVRQAYMAYKAYLQTHGGKEPRIKGLEKYDNDQMFFMGYASVWCEHTTQKSLVNQILTDRHSPMRYRVNQVLANQPEFASAFKCREGTPMNPRIAKRCAVW